MDLILEADPAALQALESIEIKVSFHQPFGTPINQFVSFMYMSCCSYRNV